MGLFISPAQTLILSAPSGAELFAWLQSGVPGRRCFHFCPLALSPLCAAHDATAKKLNSPNQTNKTKQKISPNQIKPNPAPQENHRECNDWFVFSAGLKAAMVQHKQWAAKDGIADPSLAHHYRHSRTVIFCISRTPLIQKTFKINLTLGTGLSFYEIHFQFLFFKEKKENHIAFYIQWIKLLIIRTAGFLGNKHPTLLC